MSRKTWEAVLNLNARKTPPLKAATLALALLTPASGASAYNQDTHQLLIDYVWHVMLTVDVLGRGNPPPDQPFGPLAVTPDFSRRVQAAVRKIRDLPADLPKPKNSRCVDAATAINKFGSDSPNWDNGGNFAGMRMGLVPYPISIDYETGNDCGVQMNWTPGSAFELINQGSGPAPRPDYSGTVLGYWAQYPDTLQSDFHVGIKPTSTGGMSIIKQALIAAGAAPAATVWVTAKCAIDCVESVLSFDLDACKRCCDDAVNSAPNPVRDVVSGIDSLVPIIGDFKADAIVGMSHHLNVPLANKEYDDLSGLLIVNAGPYGIPGALETLATAIADAAGATVRYDDSDGPKNYEVVNPTDGPPGSRHRDAADWEFLPFPHVPMPPVDNLGWYGHEQYSAGHGTKYLGYMLHALADASVPMHVTGAFGWGHRPYEDAVTMLHEDLLIGNRRTEPTRLNASVLPRAQAYYKIISDWRAANPAQPNGIPVRVLITAVAETTWALTRGDASLFNDQLSVGYLTPGVDIATQIYTGHSATMRQLLNEAAAASIAFLVATGDALP